MHVELVDFVSVPTRDTVRAVAWYRDVILHRRYAPRMKRRTD
jgi:hypothetical protein